MNVLPLEPSLGSCFRYGSRDRPLRCEKGGSCHGCAYDDLGSLTLDAGFPRALGAASRPIAPRGARPPRGWCSGPTVHLEGRGPGSRWMGPADLRTSVAEPA